MKSVKQWVTVAAAGLLVVSLGVLAGKQAADQGDQVRALSSRASAAESRAARARAERDRLRAERDQLEARLAAGKRRPICPTEYLSTADSNLLPGFRVDYPCGWHVVFDARSSTASAEDRGGIRAEVVLFSRLPIAFAPREGPLADIELADWTDDPNVEEDELPPLDRWVTDERSRFAPPPAEDRFEVDDGVTVVRLHGTQHVAGEPAAVSVLLWEFSDATGLRHVARGYAVAPNKAVRAALNRLARSFEVLRRT